MNLPINFKCSPIWKRSMDLAIAINHSIRTFPIQEKHHQGLCDQLLQASIRVTSRIAEAHQPLTDSPVDMFLRARFHLSETEFLLDVSRYLNYINDDERRRLQDVCQEIRDLLTKQLKRSQRQEFTY